MQLKPKGEFFFRELISQTTTVLKLFDTLKYLMRSFNLDESLYLFRLHYVSCRKEQTVPVIAG